ncbi:MAG: glycosyltransferase family 2 protein [Bacteroidales bacterium]|nr:glycosyltransferase family 2 protein [Bacteroidales bacterium]
MIAADTPIASQAEDVLVTIVVVTYNSARYIIQTLESVAHQSYRRLQLIISDDCSQDDTPQLCRQWVQSNQERFAEALFIQTPANGGIVANYNWALQQVRGQWVKYIAGDDLLQPQCINRLMDHAQSGAHFYTSDYIQLLEESGKQRLLRCNLPTASARKQLCSMLLYANIIHGCSLFLHVATLRQLGGFDSRFPMIEDYPIAMRFLTAGQRIEIVAEPLVVWRSHADSVSRSSKSFEESIYSAIWHYARQQCLRKGMPLHRYNYWVDEQIYRHPSRRLTNYLLRCIDLVHWKRKVLPPQRTIVLPFES